MTALPGASAGVKTTMSAAAIDAGSGNDSVVNDGRVGVTVNAPVEGVAAAPGRTETGCSTPKGSASGKRTAQAVDIAEGGGNDRVDNRGPIAVDAAAAGGTQTGSPPCGLARQGQTSPHVAVTASSARADAPTLPLRGPSNRPEATQTTAVSAVGIDGGNGQDTLRNEGALTVTASATASGTKRSLTLAGGDEVTATTAFETRAVGIAAGTGTEKITNTGALTVNATSQVSGVSVELSAIDLSHADTSTFVRSSATGIDGGSRKDDITIANTGTIAANATSKSSGVGVELSLVDAATGDSNLDVQSTATGIAGGQSKNRIDISGAVKATATSQATDVGVTVNYFDITIADRQGSDASTTVDARAIGIDGGKGESYVDIKPTGIVGATATSTVSSIGVGLGIEGVPQNIETLISDRSLASIGITASSMATGIAGGKRDDHVINGGSVTANATSTATQTNVGIGISLLEIVIPIPNIGLVGAGTGANATATGIDAGGGNDTIQNSGLVKSDATATANAKAFSINLGVFSVGPSGIPLGASLIVADAATTASAQSAGIKGGAGDDTVRNTGTVQTQATANAGALGVSASANVEYEKGEKLFTLDAVAARGVTAASSQSVGIDGGAGRNRLSNEGGVTVGAASNATAVGVAVNVAGTLRGAGGVIGVTGTDTSSTATADATGMRGGSDYDRIANTGSVGVAAAADVASVSTSVTAGIAKQGLVVGVGLARADSNATAAAIGINGGGGHDKIENTGTIAATAKADADSVAVSVTVEGTAAGLAAGAALTRAAVTATSNAVGVDGGAGDDSISSTGAIALDKTNATATTVGVATSVVVAKAGAALGAALAHTDATAEAKATALDGGQGSDSLINRGTITINNVTAASNAVSVSLSAALSKDGLSFGGALASSENAANALAQGLDGGKGDDYLLNKGSIALRQIESDADAVSVSIGIAGVQQGVALGGALVSAGARAEATALGMAGAEGNDKLVSLGSVTIENVHASSDAVGASVGIGFAQYGVAVGAALARTGTESKATARGLDGGTGHDYLESEGSVLVKSVKADASAVSVSVGAAGVVGGLTIAAGLTDASGRATASANALDGGAGDDVIINRAKVDVQDVGASAHATGVSVQLAGALNGVAGGLALANTSGIANASAAGIAGGDGNDTLINKGEIALDRIKADADATSVAVAANVILGGGVAAGVTLSDASGTASVTAAGMDGGAGRDTLVNTGSILIKDAAAEARATSVSVSVQGSMAGVAAGAAIANTNVKATTVVKGLDGGAGDDALYNSGSVDVHGRSTANGASVGINVNAAIGAGVGVQMTDASATAETTTVGIDGGTGRDRIGNTGSVSAGAQAASSAAAVSVGVTVAIGGDATLADARSTATATAIGINDAAGSDQDRPDHRKKDGAEHGYRHDPHESVNVIANSGAVTATAIAASKGAGFAGNLLGFALGETTNTSTANAIGLRMSDDRDRIENEGAINAGAEASASGLSVAVTLGGKAMGDAGTTAAASATGIRTGGGNDEIENRAAINADARASAAANSVSVGLIGVSKANAATTAGATAIGIDGGAGKDAIVNHSSITASAGDAAAAAEADCTAAGGACARAANVSVNLGGAGIIDATTAARSAAIGIAGGADSDSIYSDGAVDATTRARTTASGVNVGIFGATQSTLATTASAAAVGISGGDGNDAIVTASRIKAAAASHIAISGTGVTVAGSGRFNATMSATALATAIDGGAGADRIYNYAALSAAATSTLSSSGRSNVVFGSSGTAAESGAITNAVGIDAGDDDDTIRNKGLVNANSSATLSMSNSSFNFGGSGGTQGTLAAITRSAGIAGGSGKDAIENEGDVQVLNVSTLSATGGSNVVFGSSGAGATTGSFTDAVGIDGGAGDDVIHNKATISVGSTSNLTLSGSSYTFGGTGDVTGKLAASTRSTGIQGGEGNDSIRSDGDVFVGAKSTLQSGGSVNTTFGTSATDAVATTDTRATGIDSGAGDDVLKNSANVSVNASAEVNSSNASYVFGGGSSSSASIKASATATGLRGGDGNNDVENTGAVTVHATASITGSGSSYAEFGNAIASGEVVSASTARGIDGGAGADRIVNHGAIEVKSSVSAISTHNTDTGFLFGGGDSMTRARAEMTAIGIDAGHGNNSVLNTNSIAVESFGTVSTKTSSDGADIFDGDAFSRSDSVLSATAIGVASGDGASHITNTGSIKVKTWREGLLLGMRLELPVRAISDAYADGDGIDGDGTAHSFATTNVFAAGINAGNGGNTIRNDGAINVDLRANATALAVTDADAGGTNTQVRGAFVTARGYGIRTGSGNDTIVNRGTINVSVRADNNTGSAHVTATATGIESGAGNDTIINEGTITATTIVNGVTATGTAISAGAGDDIVRLRPGSVTNGNIDLGSGDNTLSLEGTPIINGTFVSGSSGLGLVFDNAGSYGGGLPGVSAVKNGPGTFTLSMLNKMERIEVNQGTLRIDNDYSFLGSGSFQAKVYGDGTSGQFTVNGRAELDGRMKIVRGGGAYVNGTTFDVLTARNGIQAGTTFSSMEMPDDTRLLKFRAEQRSDSVRVRADVASFTTVAGTSNQMAVARHLDRILPKTSGELNQVLGNMQVLPDTQFATAFASMSPAVYANYSASTYSNVQQYANVLHDRMAALRANDSAPLQSAGAARDEPMRLAYSGRTLSELLDAREAERARSSGLWLRGFSQKGDQNADDGLSGFGYRLAGTTVGFDHRFTDRFAAGISLGTVKNKVRADRDMSEGDVVSTMGSFYAGYFDRGLHVTAALSAGRNEYDTRRNIVVGTATAPVTSSHDGDVRAATLAAGYEAQLGPWGVEAFATLQSAHLKEGAFSESGSGAGLNVAARSADALVSTVGARISRPIKGANGGSWVPHGSLAWLHDYSDNHVISASYVDAPEGTFSINGQPIKRNGALLGLGMSYRTTGGITSTLQYNGEFRDRLHAHGFVGELRFEF
ncbi:MAG: autotransporter domain-containing protein [Burkholderiales bacterium]